MKKGLSLLLSLLMVISMFSCLSVVASAATSDYQLDTMYVVYSGDTGTFVVEEDGLYVFSSYGEGDPKLTIYDSDGYEIAEYDDDLWYDFQGVEYLEAGEYTLEFYNYDAGEGMDTINFKIEALNMDITSASITLAEPFELAEEVGGAWSERYNEATDEYENYYHYYYSVINNDGDTITLTYGDGTSKAYVYDSSINVWEAADGSRLVTSLLDELTNQMDDPWLPGKANYMTLSYLGVEFYSPVTIVGNPVESIAFDFVEYFYLLHEIDGSWHDRYNEETGEYEDFYYYTIPSANECYGNAITVNYTDGRSVTYVYTEAAIYDEYYRDGWISSEGEVLDLSQCDITTSHNQYETPWDIGGENLLEVNYMGKTAYVTVPVIENPVESISLTFVNPEDFTIVKESNGSWEERYNDDTDEYEDFYCYNVPYLYELGNVLTVNYTDGTTVNYTYSEVYNEVEDWYDYDWYSEDGEQLDYLKTGIDFSSNQMTTPWVLGSNNFITVKYMFKEYKIPVTIIENPVASIEFTLAEPYEYIENYNGYWDERYNEDAGEYEAFFHYYTDGIYDYDNALTVHYTDGSSRVFVYDSFYDEEIDEYTYGWFSVDGFIEVNEVDYTMNQHDKPWVLGGNNYFTVEYSGRECQVPVTIKANPIESIEFIPANGSVSVFENTNGYWDSYWDYELEGWVEYYYYRESILNRSGNAIKVNFTNGSSSTYYYSDFENGWINENDDLLDYDYLTFESYQDDGDYWTIGNDNIITIEYFGKTVDVTVKVLEPVDDVTDGKFVAEVINETECHIIEAYESAVVNGVLTVPEAIGGYTVTGMDSWLFYELPPVKEINLPSGFINLSYNTFNGCEVLEKVNVSENNPIYASMNGVIYNKALTEFVYCPPCFNGDLYIPAGVEIIDDSVLAAMGNASSIIIDENNPNFVYEDGIIYDADYTEIIKAVNLPENYVMKSTVEKIGAYAFSGNTTVKNATVSPTVTEISYCAFLGCSALESVELPEGLIGIAYSAFKDSGLKSVALPSTVEYINSDAFENCGALTSVALNEGLQYISSFAFANSGVTSVVIPNSVTIVDYKAFYNCDSLTNVVIGSGVGELTSSNFADCDSLKEFNVPATIEQLSASVINDCSSLERINVASNNPHYSSIDGVLFDKYAEYMLTYPDGKAGAYTVPSSVIDIQGAAFDSASKLTSVVIPGSVKYINSETFINCTALSQVVLSEGVKEIDYYAFENCKSLAEINIPASVTWIGGRAFLDCTALKAINVAEGNTEYASQNGLLYDKSKTTLILAPYGIEGEVVVPQGTAYIESFADCKNITSVVLPEGVTEIYGAAFSHCTNLAEINLPDTVTNISYMAFSGCSSLKTIKLPSSITKIAWGTFEYCENLEAIEIPASVTLIEEDAFWNCTSLKDVYYTGTEEQWNAIEIEYGNEDLLNATIHFNSFMPEEDATPTLVQVGETWYYMAGNKVISDYTGLVNYYDTWYYVENGVLNWGYTGLTDYYGTWYYVENGVLNWNYTGLAYHYGSYYYVENGVLNWNYTGLAYHYGSYYYVENGVLNWGYTGLTEHYGTWYYVAGGILDWGYTGLTEHYGTWYYVAGGILDWGYTGLTEHYGTWYYVAGGILDWGYTGLVNHYGTWYYVAGGVLDWNYTGLTEHYGTWYYVAGGVLDWNYTGLVDHYGTWYYVAGGVLDWNYTGLVNHYGTWYYVAGGVLDWGYTGYTNYYGTAYYITGGYLDWSKQ